MESFLNLLRGKKSAIATVIGLLITFALSRGYLAGDTANLLAGILAALGIGVNVAEHMNS